MKVAVIPARGGSQRIPRKNIKAFGGQPMIAWSIRAAVQSGCFDQVIVSTDDDEIAQVAMQCGASVPFIRPAALADHFTGTTAVLAHAVGWVNAHIATVAQACCIYATAPFITPDDLRRGLETLASTGCDYAFSVTSYAFPIQRALRITTNERIQMLQPEHLATRSQDLEAAWHDAGQFYWGKASAWLASQPVLTSDTAPVPLPRHRVQDIDTPEDWQRAELMFAAWQSRGFA